uniref:Zgc:194221 n=1 Tax=Sinocyclocheilus grahami TaxID=75366 RepID=A0A672R0C1_SINGR
MLTQCRVLALVLALDGGVVEPRRKKGRTRRSVWVHEILGARKQLSEYHRLVQELKLDVSRFKEYFRMSRHVAIQAPSSTGSMYYNYKGSFSIVLLAVVDARYLFRIVDVGAYGKSSDGGTLYASDFGKALHQGGLDLPEDAPLPGAEDLQPVPHVFVGDEAFPLKKNLLRPYPENHLDREKRVFNYRLSRAMRMVECTFGILAAQWRLYHRVLGVSPKVADAVVKATCILHNFLQEESCVPLPLAQQLAMQPIQRVGSNNASREALEIRQRYTSYFSSPAGEVAWQHSVL